MSLIRFSTSAATRGANVRYRKVIIDIGKRLGAPSGLTVIIDMYRNPINPPIGFNLLPNLGWYGPRGGAVYTREDETGKPYYHQGPGDKRGAGTGCTRDYGLWSSWLGMGLHIEVYTPSLVLFAATRV